jgi:hypothetical protein
VADFVFNRSKGRVVEFYNRVDTNDPANSALVMIVLKNAGIESDAVLKDYDDISTLLAAANDEATNTGYARKVLTDADLNALTVDDVNDRIDIDIPDWVQTSVGSTGGSWGKVIIAYDNDTTGGTDANLIPLTAHDAQVTPDGTNITVSINTAGFFRAQ